MDSINHSFHIGAQELQQGALDVNVKEGETFEIVLEGNPTTGYTWILRGDVSNVKPTNLSEYNTSSNYVSSSNDPEICGAPGKFHFHFHGQNKGQDKFQLVYKRPWLQEDDKVLNVNVNIQ